jgi:3-oxoacyl-[acyl-carrier-protein] synthase-3
MRNATIAGTGTAIPDGRITNADFEAQLDTSDEWIVERTGIRERRVAAPDESTATLAIHAGAAALKDAGLTPDDVNLLIVATATPEQLVPGTSAFVHEGLGLRCGAFDVGAACAGFVYGLVTASSLLATGGLDNVLLVGAETLTRIVDPDDRATAVLFGDAAGAVVVAPAATEGRGLLGWDLGCDGTAARLLEVRAGGSRLPASAATVAAGEHYLKMEGREVFRRAVRAVVDSAQRALERAELTADDVDVFIPHQANARIVEAAAGRLGIDESRTVVNIERFGNTSAASIPVALAEAVDEGRVHDGDIVLLSGFGAGMTWASAVLRWGA